MVVPIASRSGKTEFAGLTARDLRFRSSGGVTSFSSSGAQAAKYRVGDLNFNGLTGRNVRIADVPAKTDVDIDNLRSDSADLQGSRVKNVTADRFSSH